MPTPSVVITTIYEPSQAILAYAQMADIQLVVVADQKTPLDWHIQNGHYLSLEAQSRQGSRYKLIGSLPFHHYARKIAGYLHAIDAGAEIIIDTDDDTLPKPTWRFPPFEGEFAVSPQDLGFINIYQSFTNQPIWPRGFPLLRIQNQHSTLDDAALHNQPVHVGIWQGLIDGDTDVDALYRLTNNTPCYFNERPPIILAEGTLSCMNSQNTAFHKAVFPLLYLPSSVSSRVCDILRGLVAQPIMWLYGYNLGYTQATTIHHRNPHNLLHDFELEIPVYLYSEKIVEIVINSLQASQSMTDNVWNAYEGLYKSTIVDKIELERVTYWLEALNTESM